MSNIFKKKPKWPFIRSKYNPLRYIVGKIGYTTSKLKYWRTYNVDNAEAKVTYRAESLGVTIGFNVKGTATTGVLRTNLPPEDIDTLLNLFRIYKISLEGEVEPEREPDLNEIYSRYLRRMAARL